RPRFEAPGKPPLLLRDYFQFGSRYEIDFAQAFASTPQYLAAAVEAISNGKLSLEELTKKDGLDVTLLGNWIDLLALTPASRDKSEPGEPRFTASASVVQLLDESYPNNDLKPVIAGWRQKASELPSLATNSSDKTERIPGTLPGHHVAVHPTPTQFAGAVW